MTARPLIDNARARRLFLGRHALAEAPSGPAAGAPLADLVERLGFVQVDSIRTLERAHHMILHARRRAYRPEALKRLIERDRALFEHWTHDAAVIPVRFWPFWRRAIADSADRIAARWEGYGREGFRKQADKVLEEIARRGPVLAREMGEDEARSSGGWWEWNPSKTALEWLWRSGRLAVARREGFQKVYDLAERVIPAAHHDGEPPPRAELIDWACGAALDRLGFATTGEIAAFWGLATPEEAKAWARGRRDLIEVEIEAADGARRAALALPDLPDEPAPEAPGLVRALSPFDPALRDRKRSERLFGFHYRIEVFTPAAKRRFGYYVFPLLEGDRMIGRIDMKADREADALAVSGLWLEPGVRASAGRMRRIEAEIERQRRFAGVAGLRFADGWVRE